MTLTNYSLSFVILTETDVDIEVSATSEAEAISKATELVLETLDSGQSCHLNSVQALTPVTSGYTSMASLYSSQTQPSPQAAASNPDIPGYTRLIN